MSCFYVYFLFKNSDFFCLNMTYFIRCLLKKYFITFAQM